MENENSKINAEELKKKLEEFQKKYRKDYFGTPGANKIQEEKEKISFEINEIINEAYKLGQISILAWTYHILTTQNLTNFEIANIIMEFLLKENYSSDDFFAFLQSYKK